MQDARTQDRRGFVRGTFRFIGGFLLWLMFSLIFSIIMEWIGLTFWWPEEGATHSLKMYEAEIGYLADDMKDSLISADPAGFAADVSEASFRWLWVETGGLDGIRWLSRPPPPDANLIQHIGYSLKDYALATVNTTQVFALRVAILTLAMPVFLLFGLVGLVDGIAERDIRTWSGGRESGYVFHWAIKFVTPALILTWAIYLSMPISVHPGLVVLPFAIMFALALRVSSMMFKKYL